MSTNIERILLRLVANKGNELTVSVHTVVHRVVTRRQEFKMEEVIE